MPARPSAHEAALRTVFGPTVPTSSLGPPRRTGAGADRQHGIGDLLPRPDPAHDLDAFGHAAHGLGLQVGAHRLVVLVAAADTDADREPTTRKHVAGGQRLGAHHRVMQLGHDHRRHQLDPVGPRRQCTEQRQAVRVVEGDAFTPAQRRERSVIDGRGPRPQHGRVQIRFHHRHRHPYLHVRDSGTRPAAGSPSSRSAAFWHDDRYDDPHQVRSRMSGSP